MLVRTHDGQTDEQTLSGFSCTTFTPKETEGRIDLALHFAEIDGFIPSFVINKLATLNSI
jgi:predicted component of type VI protein secretion system